jgi:NAD(P)-dependent dehydrogenase (short-subunit alcohol dehydrogenase family)
MKVVIFGATKGIGRALARLFAERGDALVLLGRDPADLERSARDLLVRGAAAAATARCDLSHPDQFAAALEDADRQLDGFDCVVVTAAPFGTQEALENDPALAAEVLGNGFTNTVLFCEEARRRLQSRGGGTLAVFSSVAGERGRKPVVLYGAAKAGLSRYLEGLDHRYRAAGLRVVCIKPGFVKTGMTAGLKAPPFSTTAEVVARRALKAIDRGEPEVYVPGIWRWIMLVIRLLPRFVMRRVSF